MQRRRLQMVRVLFATTLIALTLQPLGRASAGSPVALRASRTEPVANVGSDDASVSGDADLGTCGTDPCDSGSDSKDGFAQFVSSVSPKKSGKNGDASSTDRVDATVTEFPSPFSRADVSGSITGSAHRDKGPDVGPGIPVADGTVGFGIDIGAPGPTQIDVTVDFSGLSNDDPADCTEGDATLTTDEGESGGFDAVRVAGGDCPAGHGRTSFSGVIQSDASLVVTLQGSVDETKQGFTHRFGGNVSVSISAHVLPPQGCGSGAPRPASGRRAQQCIPLGQILYATGGDIFVMDPGGVNPAQPLGLTAPPDQSASFFDSPVWSPDGAKVAFQMTSQPAGTTEIFTMSAGGSQIQQLTTEGNNFDPSWSPDGSKIAFDSDRDGNRELYVMKSSDGANQTRLTNNAAGDGLPSWSPDGSTIAFVSKRTGVNGDIFTVPATGGAVNRLTNDPHADNTPVFASDGTIFFSTDRDGNFEIYTMGSDGGNQQDFTNDPGADEDPTISPDDQFVGFASDRGGSSDIWEMPIGGGDAVQLTQGANPDEADWGASACTVYGTDGNDTLTGDGTVCGGPGDDRIKGGSAGDVLDGGLGGDTINGDQSIDLIIGGDGIDKIQGGTGKDLIDGNEGGDIVNAGSGNDIVSGGPGKDDILGGPGDDDIVGGEGNDTLAGGPGHDDIQGGPQNDDITDGPDGDIPPAQTTFPAGVFGGPGDDTIDACNTVKDRIDGGDGHDVATTDAADALSSIEVRHAC